MSELEFLFEKLSVKEEINPYFIISAIALVPDANYYNDSSSDEELDDTFEEKDFESYSIQNTIKKQSYHVRKIKQYDKMEVKLNTTYKSKVVDPFLKQLHEEAFESYKNMQTNREQIVVSIALNRMLSVSTRKNCSLFFELNANCTVNSLKYEKFGFFWKCQWENRKNKKVNYKIVRKFYKQLKRKNPEKAKEFLRKEDNALVPFQELREYAKNHPKTKELVQYLRRSCSANIIYFTLMDCDTYSFNGVFSAYIRVVYNYYEKNKKLPTIMSTGYEYYCSDETYRHMLKIASQIDRKIRIVTSKRLPLCVYYPEPNMCVLIPENADTLPESFIHPSKKDGKNESSCLIKNMINKREINLVFSDDLPLITIAPPRAVVNKAKPKTRLSFTPDVEQGASPLVKDIKRTNQVTQSNQHSKVWYDNLFINGGIEFINKLENYVKINDLQTCQRLLKTVKKSTVENDKNKAVKELAQFNIKDMVLESLTIYDTLKECKHLLAKLRKSMNEITETNDELKLFLNSGAISQYYQQRKYLSDKINNSGEVLQNIEIWFDKMVSEGDIKFINKLENYVKIEELETCKLLMKDASQAQSPKTKKYKEAVKKLEKYNLNLHQIKSISVSDTLEYCKMLLKKIDAAEKEIELTSDKLKYYISSENVGKIKEVIKDFETTLSESEKEYCRSEDESELIEIIKNADMTVGMFGRDKILILSQTDVINLFKEKLVNIKKLVNVNVEILKVIFYDNRILNVLLNKTLRISDILKLFNTVPLTVNEVVEFYLEDILNSIEFGKLPSKEIINNFLDNPLFYINL